MDVKIVDPEIVKFWKEREVRGNASIPDGDLLNVWSQQVSRYKSSEPVVIPD